mmetsp:Transcript_23424/g.43115  ORF Transcript_23424/g.43115 Transcript_23424/m.43115 type:complete len:307 (+) Transcript_23424:1278-2198(+)
MQGVCWNGALLCKRSIAPRVAPDAEAVEGSLPDGVGAGQGLGTRRCACEAAGDTYGQDLDGGVVLAADGTGAFQAGRAAGLVSALCQLWSCCNTIRGGGFALPAPSVVGWDEAAARSKALHNMSKSAESSLPNCSCIVGLQPTSLSFFPLAGTPRASPLSSSALCSWLPMFGWTVVPATGVDVHLVELCCASWGRRGRPASMPAVAPSDNLRATSSFLGGRFSLHALASAVLSRTPLTSFKALSCHVRVIVLSSFTTRVALVDSGSHAMSLLLPMSLFCSERCHLCSCVMSPLKVTELVYSSCAAL